jgi:hypothetical protein
MEPVAIPMVVVAFFAPQGRPRRDRPLRRSADHSIGFAHEICEWVPGGSPVGIDVLIDPMIKASDWPAKHTTRTGPVPVRASGRDRVPADPLIKKQNCPRKTRIPRKSPNLSIDPITTWDLPTEHTEFREYGCLQAFPAHLRIP